MPVSYTHLDVYKRQAHDEVAVAEPLHILFAHELGRAVGADGPGQGGFILRDAAVLPAGELSLIHIC